MSEPMEYAFAVTAERGEVMVDGNALAFSLTIEAAQELSDQLGAAIVVALGQRLTKANQVGRR